MSQIDCSLSDAIVQLKRDYVRSRRASAFLSEVVPYSLGANLVQESVLASLHKFARANPIYRAHKDLQINGALCSVYEADITGYWLDSKKHDSSYQPFYPTWLLSAFALAHEAKNQGFSELVDIGSGDGRIAYCGAVLGIESYGLELDPGLVRLQQEIVRETGVPFHVLGSDATRFDYSGLDLRKPLFLISGLPEHGEMLASAVIEQVLSRTDLAGVAGFNFMGSHVMKSMTRDHTLWGWGEIVSRFALRPVGTLTLPTYWTTDEKFDTPYLYAASV